MSLIDYTMKPDSAEDLQESKIIEILYQGLSGLEYLDSKKLIHYDIKRMYNSDTLNESVNRFKWILTTMSHLFFFVFC